MIKAEVLLETKRWERGQFVLYRVGVMGAWDSAGGFEVEECRVLGADEDSIPFELTEDELAIVVARCRAAEAMR